MRVDNVGRVDADLLDQLGVESPTYRLGELERFHVAEHRRGSDISYLVACDEHGIPVGMMPVYIAGPPWEPTVDPASIFDPPAPMGGAKLCLAGSAGAYANFLEVGAAIRGAVAARVATALVEQVLVVARDAGCRHVLLPYLDEAQSLWLHEYDTMATARSVRHKAVLPVDWDSFDDYLGWLPSHRRRRVRHERRVFERSGIDVREARLVDVAAKLAPLLTQTENRYGRDVNREQMEFYLLMLGMHMEGDSFTLVAYRNERPVAFSLALLCSDRWVMRSWGCDYASVGREGFYFNLVYYEPIVRAIERGARLIDFGVGALEAKTLRGCRLEPLWTILVPPAAVPSRPSPPPRGALPAGT
jgi:predicted N-acyltransferase